MPDIELIDLRPITRKSKKVATTIEVRAPQSFRWQPWIKLGICTLTRDNNSRAWTLKSHLNSGATDFEHDSAYALRLGLIGVEVEMVLSGTAMFSAFIKPDIEDFRVPNPGYDPAKLEGADICENCEKPHPIVPENHYIPPENQELYDVMAGMEIRITLGHAKE